MPWYFAYGSNMNLARVEARIGETRRVLPATLEEYALRFNKASKVPGIAHANVVPAAGKRVEGALFELMVPEQIASMDPFEGYPHEYTRQRLPLQTAEGVIDAWVYIASTERQGEGLKPAREYLEHLLAGRDFLSEGYHQALAAVEAVEHLDDATLGRLGLSRHHPR
ncbi:gamma-glutamylcyclotransferase [Halomonas litopenaei]|uniref:gamma-glutamylcyclotransferase n=1 Tax=Halomonas litopenaei TaxID=2109328 RepID=UPI001A8C3096|nr:gamma-glutamylcyclotransferase [Halomonas litopenaei]